ncbi:MAG: class I SAM-dependent methyltransferase [Planctomycetia bacterium]|nr:class I SAM-dependent methyltransferase [Planctomycetia bacterium]
MRQNIFDNPSFLKAYLAYRSRGDCPTEKLAWPALQRMLPPLQGLHLLDIGSGMGEFCLAASKAGALSVTGIDISAQMCALAQKNTNAVQNIRLINLPVEDFETRQQTYDLVVSSLSLHYVESFANVVKRIASWLRPGGQLIMSINHPFYTANLGADGTSAIVDYHLDGPRPHKWFVDGVVKYHRTFETNIRVFQHAELQLADLSEVSANSSWKEEQIGQLMPLFVFFKCLKIAGSSQSWR